MNIIKFLSIVVLTACLLSCNNSNKTETDEDSLTMETSVDSANAISPDTVVIKFLKWYRDNEERLGRIPLVSGMDDSSKPYAVDFKATETYLAELKNSGFISDKFLDDLKSQFNKSDKYMKENPENDGPPFGFDADLIMQAQDFSDVWQNLYKAEVTNKKIEGKQAKLRVRFTEYYKTNYYLTRRGNSWQIDKIENSFEDKF